MRTLYIGVLIGALAWLAGLADNGVRAEEPATSLPLPWADALLGRATAPPSDPAVIAVSNPPIPVDVPDHDAMPVAGGSQPAAMPSGSVGRGGHQGVFPMPAGWLPTAFRTTRCSAWTWTSTSGCSRQLRASTCFSDAQLLGRAVARRPGQTQGNIDYTRREFDMTSGVAWNYYGSWELRGVGFDRENFNRGVSQVSPGGTTNDGSGVEQRLYLSDEYAKLGQEGFNISRADFVSLGYFPTKSLVGGDGIQYKPGLFAHAYLTWDVPTTRSYLFLDLEQIFQQSSFKPRMLYSDVGWAINPCATIPKLEIRLGSEFNTDFNASGSVRNMKALPYVSVLVQLLTSCASVIIPASRATCR